MRTILVFVALLGLDPDLTLAASPVDKGAKKFAVGYDLLKQQKYQEARTAFEAGLQQNPANAMAHFSLGDACRGLKSWACAEVHYETSVELDAKSSVAGVAKQRGRKAKVWRLLDEGKQAINAPNASPKQIAQAEDTHIAVGRNALCFAVIQALLYLPVHYSTCQAPLLQADRIRPMNTYAGRDARELPRLLWPRTPVTPVPRRIRPGRAERSRTRAKAK